MIKVEDLKKSYGSKEILKGISFDISIGQTVGFLGANGEGKTTTMNLLTGYLVPDTGNIYIFDYNMADQSKQAKSLIGYLPEIPPLYKDMRIIEYLLFVAELKGIKGKKEEVSRVIDLFDLEEKKSYFIKHLSKGYCQRVGFAAALLGDPKVLILDEPLVGLDPSESKKIRDIIKGLRDDHCILISSHILTEIDELCNEILIIKDGKLALDESKTSAKNGGKIYQYKLVVKGDKEVIEKTLNNNSGLSDVKYITESEDGIYDYVVTSKNARDIRDNIIGSLVSKKCNVYSINKMEQSLEEIFEKINDQEGNVG